MEKRSGCRIAVIPGEGSKKGACTGRRITSATQDMPEALLYPDRPAKDRTRDKENEKMSQKLRVGILGSNRNGRSEIYLSAGKSSVV